MGAIQERRHITKGQQPTSVLVPADLQGRTTYVERAVRRKAMLYTRFLRLASREMGAAGETVLRSSLSLAGPHLLPMTDGYGEVIRLMRVRFAGALDSGAWLHTIDPKTEVPRQQHALPIEVKNRRLVLYPIHKEVHQLLSKAAELQKNPGYPIVPILVCRRAHSRLFWMAKDLVHETRRQFTTLSKGVTERHIEEIRDELSLRDLVLVTRNNIPLIREFFRETVANRAPTVAPRWAAAAPAVAVYSQRLRNSGVGPADRQEIVRDLRQHLEVVMPSAGFTEEFLSWSLPDVEEFVEDED